MVKNQDWRWKYRKEREEHRRRLEEIERAVWRERMKLLEQQIYGDQEIKPSM